jgi:large-conductance mechanosensitive channel
MLTFLLEEGVLSVGALSGIFTANLLSSFKSNILDPLSENVAPSHKLDLHAKTSHFKEQDNKTHKILWQTFLKDLILWIIIMFILYIIWKYLIKKINK